MCDSSDSSHPLSGCNSHFCHFRQATALFEILWRVSCICSSTVSILSQLHGQPTWGGNPQPPGDTLDALENPIYGWTRFFRTWKNRMRILRSRGRYQSSTAPSAYAFHEFNRIWPGGGFRKYLGIPIKIIPKLHHFSIENPWDFADALFSDMSMLVAKV